MSGIVVLLAGRLAYRRGARFARSKTRRIRCRNLCSVARLISILTASAPLLGVVWLSQPLDGTHEKLRRQADRADAQRAIDRLRAARAVARAHPRNGARP